MRVLPLLVFSLVLIFAAPTINRFVVCVSPEDCTLAPWSGEADASRRAEEKIIASLQSGQRPDILDFVPAITDVASLADHEEGKAMARRICVAAKCGFAMPDKFQMGVLQNRMQFLLPMLYSALGYVFDRYRDSTIVFLGRDCDFVYDTARLLARGTALEGRIKLLPASMDLLNNIYANKYFKTEDGRALVDDYLAVAGISEDAFKRQETFVFIDTGFMGSAASMLMGIIRKHFATDINSVSRLFQSKLLLSTFNPQLQLDFPGAHSSYMLHAGKWDDAVAQDDFLVQLTDETACQVLGVGMQLFPKYTAALNNLSRDGRRKLVIEPKKLEGIDHKIESIGELNGGKYNPAAAVLMQSALAQMVDMHIRSGDPHACNAVASALVVGAEILSRAA